MRRVLLIGVLLAGVACKKAPENGGLGSTVQPGPPGPSDGGGQTGPSDGGGSQEPPKNDPHRIGGMSGGPWGNGNLTVYGPSQGLLESPLSASVDESENLWVVSDKALYLLAPGAQKFRRYTAQDGLHVGPGYTEAPDFTLVQGGGNNECFVGYYARDTSGPGAHTANDPWAHMGKMDQVLLHADGSLEVRRYDLRNSNDGFYYETRTIMSMVYDHFQHPGDLYVGSNHGVTLIHPAKWRLPANSTEAGNPIAVEREWYGDHVHPWVCRGGPCSDTTKSSTFGDWFGITLAADGRLWMGGLTSAGAIGWKADLTDWTYSWAPFNPFIPAFGDPYPGNPPVFNPPQEGDPVNIRGVAVTPDGTAWFASGEAEAWRGPTYGLASWDGRTFLHVDPTSLGAIEYNILELTALPDGRLVMGFPMTGLLVWKPGEPRGHRLTVSSGLPGEQIRRVSLDLMHQPPLLLVPTDGGLAVLRDVP